VVQYRVGLVRLVTLAGPVWVVSKFYEMGYDCLYLCAILVLLRNGYEVWSLGSGTFLDSCNFMTRIERLLVQFRFV